ncbi:MAG TPA: succinate dehydrogenase assembly factor 2 [Alphaproteobacteria bacterium]|jgi:antitoxin CptB|nr:succinate dehydrogenase assembly factor 2 [Alphaproteobacteria bacterium]
MEKGSTSDKTADAEGRRRKRLRFRSWHRGTRELDLLLGPFADRHLDALSAAELAEYEALLLMPDPDVYDWILGQAEPPPAIARGVLRLIKKFHKTD